MKHYQGNPLQVSHVNTPVLDPRLVFEVLANQPIAFQGIGEASPDTLVAYHFLATRIENAAGYDAVFEEVREASVANA